MKVIFAASECAPFVKVGGLGDVVGALPKALRELGVEVAVVVPFYEPVFKNCRSREGWNLGKKSDQGDRIPGRGRLPDVTSRGAVDDKVTGEFLKREGFTVRFSDEEQTVTVYESNLPGSEVPIFFLSNDKYLSNGGIYFDKSAFASSQEEITRFAFFSKAVAAFCEKTKPSVVHCHDWHTGLVPFFLKDKHLPTVFTVHNLANQGFSTLAINKSLDLSRHYDRVIEWDEKDSNLDLILQGIIKSTVVTTVSQKYAQEILTPEAGEGLQDVLKAREGDLRGIVNGIDTKTYDPRTDLNIPAHYDSELFVEGKLKNKMALQRELVLTADPKKMLIGIVTRLSYQKGLDLVLSSLNEIMRQNGQLVILGTGEESLEEKLRAENDRLGLSGNFKAVLRFDEALSRRIYAASDVLLVPSRFEPCGLTQLIAMRYGTLPIVRAVGGLYDTVRDGETGFSFLTFSPKALGEVITKAHKTFLNPYSWQKMVTTAMAVDWSWRVSAEKYVAVYREAIKKFGEREDVRFVEGGSLRPPAAKPATPAVIKGGAFRFDKTRELWTIIAPSRKSRPVATEVGPKKQSPLDPFAPGNEGLTPPEVWRIGRGAPDQPGWRVRVVPNKFPITAWHEVIIHHPDGHKSWAEYTPEEAADILRAYQNRLEFYSAERADFYPHLYCNYGAEAGASLAHPHSQLVVFDRLPEMMLEETAQAEAYYDSKDTCVYCRLLENESVFPERVIWEDQFVVALTPFASAWPYEALILPKRHACDFTSIDSAETASLATALTLVTGVIKRKFGNAAYNFWLHSVPQYGDYRRFKNSYHWHFEFVPRLKYLGGIEIGAGVMVDDKATPEEAARFYRENLV